MMERLPKFATKKENQEELIAYASWNFRNVYFMDDMTREKEDDHHHFKDIPWYLHMMQHVYRYNIFDDSLLEKIPIMIALIIMIAYIIVFFYKLAMNLNLK